MTSAGPVRKRRGWEQEEPRRGRNERRKEEKLIERSEEIIMGEQG